MTQRELGAAVGVQASTICRMECGHRVPHPVTYALIARELGVPLERVVHD
jgi:transcriptional regulator with XRE-family HTH domain